MLVPILLSLVIAVFIITTVMNFCIEINEPKKEKEMSKQVTDKLEILTNLSDKMADKIQSIQELTLTWEYIDGDTSDTNVVVPVVTIKGLVMKP